MRFVIHATEMPNLALMLRIPGWADSATVMVNGEGAGVEASPGEYYEIRRAWSAGDTVQLAIPTAPRLLEANPFVEEALNQAAVQRGPVVYCPESADLPDGVLAIRVPAGIELRPRIGSQFLGDRVAVLEARRSGSRRASGRDGSTAASSAPNRKRSTSA